MKNKLILFLLSILCCFLFLIGCGDTNSGSNVKDTNKQETSTNDKQEMSIYEKNFSRIVSYCKVNAKLQNGKYLLNWKEEQDTLAISEHDLSVYPSSKEIVYKETIADGWDDFIFFDFFTVSFKYGDVNNNKMLFKAEIEFLSKLNGISIQQIAIDNDAQLTISNGTFTVKIVPETNTFESLSNEGFEDSIWNVFQRLEKYFVGTIGVNLFEF